MQSTANGAAAVCALAEKLALRNQGRGQQKISHASSLASPPPKVPQLLPWPAAARGVPNVFLRSALFGIVQKGARTCLELQEIYAQGGISILYTGARLDQGDLDTWETVLLIVQRQALGDLCRVTAYQMLKLMDKADTGGNRDVLEKRLARLKATGLSVKVDRYSYMGSLIDEVYKDDETREYLIRLNPKLCALFEKDRYTLIDWAVRRQLDGKPLAQWLHGYYSSHAKQYSIKVETLHKLCSSEAELRRFRQTLGKALADVKMASEIYGKVFNSEIRGNLVHVDKEVSGTQRRHLARKRKSGKPPPNMQHIFASDTVTASAGVPS
ncbi:MAG: plasmid replication initiator TrfA [Formivibrio sp.]|nr:plasmid replication initiator TrfA [Formivibrio sp.]